MNWIKRLAVGAGAAATVTALVTNVAWATAPKSAVPSGFQTSSTVWQTARHGWVLGYANGTATLLETYDAGAHWRTRPAPPIALPDNHNLVQLSRLGGASLAVNDGSKLVVSNTDGARWSTVSLRAIAQNHFIERVVANRGRVFALASTQSGDGTSAVQLYAGTLASKTLRPVRGIGIAGGMTYGDINAAGVIQVSVGADYATDKYWISRDGVHFTTAPAPCSADTVASLTAPHDGKVSALCTTDPGLSKTGKQMAVASALGKKFTDTAQAPDQGITMDFGTGASGSTIAATGRGYNYLYGSFDGGKTWKSSLTISPDQSWSDLGFPTAQVGFVVAGQPDTDAGSTIYRTQDGGRTWAPFTVG
jgi:hypothetical protein